MKNLVNKIKGTYDKMAVLLFVFLMPLVSHAQFTELNTILKQQNVKTIITLGLALAALWKVVEFVQNFSFSSAWKDIWIPAFFIFATFQWESMLKWFGLGT